ncbi:hypothetical protein KAR91_75735 [Candidatus Pacearchaeota archaeon]|nr:hypothetical protein [Candidatus Pacearchaeota archaeon]
MNKQSEINRVQLLFRILDGWKIHWVEEEEYKGHCCINEELKIADVYEYGENEPEDYIFHEIVHICMKEVNHGIYKERREKEELFVQDLCTIIFGKRIWRSIMMIPFEMIRKIVSTLFV